jgi:Fungalysin metallopeptidase (M36)/Calx-beta domain/Fungalysin/Thermolysin Propeptide Motif
MKLALKFIFGIALFGGWSLLPGPTGALAATLPTRPQLPDFDVRTQTQSSSAGATPDRASALAKLAARVPDARVDFDNITGSPAWIRSENGFLTGTNGGGAFSAQALARFPANDPYRTTRAFLDEHTALFGHGSAALDAARVKREFITRHNGLHTVVWEQQVDGIPVFEALLISHTTSRGELVSISSHFVPAPEQAASAGTSFPSAVRSRPGLTAAQALADAAQSIGDTLAIGDISVRSPASGPEQQQTFAAGALKGDATAHLVWLPMDRNSLRLCWEVILMSRARGEMFHVLVDARTGDVLLRRSLTENISPATYRVFPYPSPAPFMAGYPTNPGAITVMGLAAPATNQLGQVPPTLVVISALDTNASPLGWINDGTNVTTSGNNVSAYLDVNADNRADIPPPQGTTNRVFDFPFDPTQSPASNSSAAVVNLFYWNNWMHDQLYDLGFTEAAGNFQVNNFGRGGVGGDPVDAEAQEGYNTGNTYYLDNASFSTPPDGSSGVMELYVFTGPTPSRDSDFDTEVILHEYTHGLSNRRVGGGVGIDKIGHPQAGGLGEGWSDFYSLALLSQAGDSLTAPYPEGPYISYLLFGATYGYNQNYYFGIRRYPYCTDTNIDPGTFKDIDPNQASPHTGVPINPVIGNLANEIHNQGEIWCAALWDARANLINKYGFATGNQLMLQLVTDGMNLTPANPTFVQARDGILQADLVDNNGVNHHQLWLAFAKRGLGVGASAPPSTTTVGVTEAFNTPDDLLITPSAPFSSIGSISGPFSPPSQTYTLIDTLSNAMGWSASASVPWVTLSTTNGVLAGGGGSTNVVVTLNAAANALPLGNYSGVVTFTDMLSGNVQTNSLALTVSQPAIYSFPLNSDPGWSRQGQWAFGQPAGLGGAIHGNPDPSSGFTGPNVFGVNLNGDYSTNVGGPYYLTTGPLNFTGCTGVLLQFERWLNSDYPPYVYENIGVSSDNTNWTLVFSNESGVIADSSWNKVQYNLSPFADNQPAVYVRWGYQIAQAGAFAYSGWNIDDVQFLGTNQISISLPASTTKNAGVISGQCQASIPHPAVTGVNVQLASSDSSRLTVPASVTIPAGQTNAPFNITILDVNQLDGTQMVSVSGSAPGLATGTGTISIYDDHTAALAVSLPASATEGDGSFPATVSMNAVPASDITVTMSCSDPTSLTVPATVTIPAGQTNATFFPSVVADNQLRGNRTVTVTAHVQNWTDGMASMVIHDNKSTNITVTLPAQARESNGLLPNAGSVGIAGTLTNNLVVSLVSSNIAKLVVPSTATIPAGQTSAPFNLTLVSGNPPETPLAVSVADSAPGFGPGSATMTIFDNQTPPAPWDPHPADQSTTNPLAYTLSWSPGLGEGVEYLSNGGFETGDFTGWFTPVMNSPFVMDDGTVNPPSGDGTTPPFSGSYSALADQPPPALSSICQTVALPANGTITLSWVDRIRNYNFDFDTNQQFRVEIRDTNGAVLSTVFTTQPGDTQLADWTQRGADLSGFAGRTVVVAFVVNAGEYYLDIDLDNVSVKYSPLPPPTYTVYYGTNPVPGPGQLLGSTTNTSWNLSQPQTAYTTYYWQVVASRANQTAGPIWQFSTLPTLLVSNVDVFIGSSGTTNAVFTVTLTDTNTYAYVYYTTADASATNPVDYISTNGTLFFNGTTNQTFTVQVNGYGGAPATRSFLVNFLYPSGAVMETNQVVGTIFNISAPPMIQSVQLIAGQIALTWTSIPGKSYRVQYKTRPTDAWSNLSGDVAATTMSSSKTDPSPLMTSRFYRIMVLP